MTNKISIFALIISTLALLFGGFLNSTWEKNINSEEVTISVNSITHGIRNIADQPIEIPPILVSKTKAARFFPSLEIEMTRDQLEKIISSPELVAFEEAALEVSLARSELLDNTTENRAIQIWQNISPESKAAIYTMKTARLIREKINTVLVDIDGEAISKLIEAIQFRDSENPENNLLMQRPEVQSVLFEVLEESRRIENNPNRDQIVNIITSELPFLQAAASESERYSKEINKLIEKADTLARNAPIYWDLSVTLFNSGGKPTSLVPAAAVAFQHRKEKNNTLFFTPLNNKNNIVLEPGKAVSLLTRSIKESDIDLTKNLIENYKIGEKNFRVIFNTTSGKKITSETTNFSKGIEKKQKEKMLKTAESIEI